MPPLSIAIILHSNVRSGSNLVTFLLAGHLARRGHRVEVLFQERLFPADIGFLDPAPPFAVGFLDDRVPPSAPVDIALTTWWECAYQSFHRVPARVYAFYRPGAEKGLDDRPGRFFDAVIDAVLDEDLLVFCVNSTLKAEMTARGRPATVIRNGVDRARFSTAESSLPPKTRPIRVLVEGPLDDPAKGIPETLDAAASVPEVEIVHVTARGTPRPDPRVAHCFVDVPYAARPGGMAGWDVILKMGPSGTWSMPVLETFAAGGTAVVGAFPGHDDYIVNGENALVGPLNDWAGVRDALSRLSEDAPLLARLRANARATATRLSWDEPFAAGEGVVQAVVAGLPPDRVASTPILDRYRACHRAILDLWLRSLAPKPWEAANAVGPTQAPSGNPRDALDYPKTGWPAPLSPLFKLARRLGRG
ncbi:hypothetical protein GAY28_02130 [Azospirillum brasilense]|nr:hypothetical protein [Azospirillum brasilense]